MVSVELKKLVLTPGFAPGLFWTSVHVTHAASGRPVFYPVHRGYERAALHYVNDLEIVGKTNSSIIDPATHAELEKLWFCIQGETSGVRGISIFRATLGLNTVTH